MTYNTPETKIPDEVIESKPTHEYQSETFGNIPVRKAPEMSKNETVFFKITDEKFAEERLKTAQKHWRDYGELPDKGQFPYVKYDGQSVQLVFAPTIFIPDGTESKDITHL